MSDRTPEGFPPEYVRLLLEMGRDPATSAEVRRTLQGLGDQTFYERVMPVPKDWRADDLSLFCQDSRVRRAEYGRRVERAKDEWIECSPRPLAGGGLPALEVKSAKGFPLMTIAQSENLRLGAKMAGPALGIATTIYDVASAESEYDAGVAGVSGLSSAASGMWPRMR